jgi:D-inositol-3-phosphate glycosyltransferase
VLVDGHDPADYAFVLAKLIAAPARLAALSLGAIEHASAFGWPVTADRLISVYTGAMNEAVVPVRA